MRTNDVDNTKTEARYVSTTGLGVEKVILSAHGETTTKDNADDLRVAKTTVTLKVEEGFGTQLFETSGDNVVSIINVCMIEEGKECEAYGFEEIATDNKIESEVAMDELMADGGVETFPTLILETSAVVSENQCEDRRDG